MPPARSAHITEDFNGGINERRSRARQHARRTKSRLARERAWLVQRRTRPRTDGDAASRRGDRGHRTDAGEYPADALVRHARAHERRRHPHAADAREMDVEP